MDGTRGDLSIAAQRKEKYSSIFVCVQISGKIIPNFGDEIFKAVPMEKVSFPDEKLSRDESKGYDGIPSEVF